MRKKKPDSATTVAPLQSGPSSTSNHPVLFNESGVPPVFAPDFQGSPRRSAAASKQPDALRLRGCESLSPAPLE